MADSTTNARARDCLRGNDVLFSAVGLDPGCAGGPVLTAWPVHSRQSCPLNLNGIHTHTFFVTPCPPSNHFISSGGNQPPPKLGLSGRLDSLSSSTRLCTRDEIQTYSPAVSRERRSSPEPTPGIPQGLIVSYTGFRLVQITAFCWLCTLNQATFPL